MGNLDTVVALITPRYAYFGGIYCWLKMIEIHAFFLTKAPEYFL